jgi:hypothetical protein
LVQGQLLRDGGEKFLDVFARLGGCLEEEKAGFTGVLFGVCGLDGALVGRLGDEIQLVAGEGDDDVLVSLALEFFDPRFRLIQRCLRMSVSGW